MKCFVNVKLLTFFTQFRLGSCTTSMPLSLLSCLLEEATSLPLWRQQECVSLSTSVTPLKCPCHPTMHSLPHPSRLQCLLAIWYQSKVSPSGRRHFKTNYFLPCHYMKSLFFSHFCLRKIRILWNITISTWNVRMIHPQTGIPLLRIHQTMMEFHSNGDEYWGWNHSYCVLSVYQFFKTILNFIFATFEYCFVSWHKILIKSISVPGLLLLHFPICSDDLIWFCYRGLFCCCFAVGFVVLVHFFYDLLLYF